MTQNWKKLLSLLLVLTMLVGMMPAVFAAEEEPAAAPEEQAEEILTEEPSAPEVPETAEEPGTPDAPETPDDPADPADPDAPEDPADPADPEDPEVPGDPEEVEDAEEEPEEEDEEPAVLPYGFPGMGEDYELSEAELAAKLAMAGLPETLAAMTPDADYVEGELMFLTDSADYAQQVADAYDAELLLFDGFFALIRMRSATVLQAVECAADPEIPLPAVRPNYIALSSDTGEVLGDGDFDAQGIHMDWEDWGFTDEWVKDPSNNHIYQYHHDILEDYAAWGASDGYHVKVAIVSYSNYDKLAALITDAKNGGGDGVGVAYAASVRDFTPTANNVAAVTEKLDKIGYDCQVVLVDAVFSSPDDALAQAVNNLISNGKIVIAPMGNGGYAQKCYPAAVPGVIAVAATKPNGTLTSTSNYGSWCDISAPGIPPAGVAYPSGTSYAAALTAGAAALYVSRYNTTVGFEDAMKKAATQGGTGAGILNTAKLFGDKPGDFWLDETCFFGSYVKSEKGVVEVSEDGQFLLESTDPWADDLNTTFVFSLDGKNPSMSNGAVTHGSSVNPGTATYLINLNLKLGKTYTLKVIAVNGYGVPGKVKSLKLRLVESADYVYPKITNWDLGRRLAAGGSYTFKAEVKSYDPSYQYTQDVTWRIEQSPETLGAKIDAKTGKLTTKAGETGTVRVYVKCANAKSMYDSFYEDDVVINVINVDPLNKVKTLTLDRKTMTLNLTNICEDPYEEQWLYATAKDANGNVLYAEDGDVGICWTSSNPDIVRVSPYSGEFESDFVQLTPYRKGTATITATAMDGSGKSASCKVTVIQHPADVDIYYKDPDTYVPLPPLVPGGSVQLSAQVTGYYLTEKANDQRVKWELDPGHTLPAELDGMVTVTSSGQIKLSKKAAPSTTYNIWIRATAKDTQYGAVYDTFPVAVRPKAKSFEMTYMGPMPYENYIKYNKNNLPVSVTLLTEDLPALPSNWGSTSAYENQIDLPWLYRDMKDNTWYDVTVTSSKPGVVEVKYSGGEVYLTALSVGSSTITVKSADGVLKHSFPVKVINPIGSVRVSSAGPNGANVVAYGKSLKLSAQILDTYGKPTSTKLEWRLVNVWGCSNPEDFKDVLSVSQSGVVTVKKGAAALNLQHATVVAYPKDYTRYGVMDYSALNSMLTGNADLLGTFDINFCGPVTKISCNTPNTVELDEAFTLSLSYTVTLNDGSITCYNSSSVSDLIAVTSSKPKLVSAKVTRTNMANYTVTLYGDPAAIKSVKPGSSDTAKITVKAVDGSGKTFSFNVKVTKRAAG